MIDKIEKIIREKLAEDEWHINYGCPEPLDLGEWKMEKSLKQLIKAIRRVLRYAPPS